MLSVEDWAEIRCLHFAEGMGSRRSQNDSALRANTVRAAVRSTDPPAYRRSQQSSAVDAFESEIRKLLKDCPTMPATVIAERVSWERGITVLKERERKQRVPEEAGNGPEVSVEQRDLTDYDRALGVA
jgi:hypothetical protein